MRLVAFLWMLLVQSPFSAAAGAVDVPPHPRLRLNASGVARLQEAVRADPLARELVHNLSARIDYMLSQPVPSGQQLLNSLQQDMYPLGLLYRLSSGNRTRRTELAKRAAEELVAVTSLEAWSVRTEMGDIRFLTIAETMQGVAIGYDWFYDALNASTKRIVEDGLFHAGLSVGMECYFQNCTWVPGIEPVGNCSSCWWIRASHMCAKARRRLVARDRLRLVF
jgi:hypothetical protein